MPGFKVAHLNMRSLVSKIDQLRIDLPDSGIDILTVSETWLNVNVENRLLSMPGYNFTRLDRQVRRENGSIKTGGGLGMYYKAGLQVDTKTLENLNISVESIELQWALVSRPHTKTILIGNIYRPPNGKLLEAFNIINNQLSQIKDLHKYETILLGDFNADNRTDKKTPAQLIRQFAAEHEFQQLIQQPTRYSKKSKTTIDLLFSNAKFCTSSGVYNYNLSDHKLIYVIKKKPRTCKLTEIHMARSYRNCNEENVIKALQEYDMTPIMAATDPNECWTKINTILTDIADKLCPLAETRIRTHTAEFLNDELLELQRDRDYFVNKADCTGDEGDRFIADCMIKKARKEIKKAKASYFKRQAIAYNQNTKKFWRELKKIDPESKDEINNILDDETKEKIPDMHLPTRINDYFVDIGVKLAEKFVTIKNNLKTYQPEENRIKFELIKTIEGEVMDRLLKQSNYKSSGMVNISARYIKTIIKLMITQFTYLYNMVISTGIFPAAWKIATITPIPKVSNPTSCNELRPISILPLPGRVLEQIIHAQLKGFLESSKYFNKQQNGFRNNGSTTNALSLVLDELLGGMDNGELILAVFIDFRKAFDTVDHNILLWKLSKAGLGENTCKLLKDYLHNRRQVTIIKDNKSNERIVSTGVPQGSTLGPLLFLLYINDIVRISDEVTFVLFADDAVILARSKQILEAAIIINKVLEYLNSWCNENKLTINTKKTEYTIFGTKKLKAKAVDIAVKIGNVVLKEVDSYKYLGTTLDATLTLNQQMARLNQQLAIKLNTFRKLRKNISENTAILIYKSNILPIIDYNDIVYSLLTSAQQTKLQRVQNRALRTVFLGQKLSVEDMHVRAKIDFLCDRQQQHLLSLMRNRTMEDTYVQTVVRLTRQADGVILKVPRPNTNKFMQAPIYKGSVAWNSLPTVIKTANTKIKFKNLVKLHQAGMLLNAQNENQDQSIIIRL